MANPHLQIEAGAEAQRFEIPDDAAEITIGRSADCQWVIPSGAVSRRHAVLRRAGNELVVEDLGSSNGTMVNGRRLTGPRALRDQDRLQLGAVEIRVVIPQPEPSADATIALDATRKLAPEPAPEPTRFVPSARPVTPTHSGKTATDTVAPKPSQPMAAATTPIPTVDKSAPAATTAAAAPFPTPPPLAAARAAAAAPVTAGQAMGPTVIELAVIAAASFLVVFGIGALLIRFVF
jgi:pSer/pThr/pTyr-binding forkhead associated (FHA) protein